MSDEYRARDHLSEELPERNPVTTEKFLRETRWQVLLPVVIGAVVVIILAVLMASGADELVSDWADISLIWLICPMMFVGLLFLALFGGLVYLTIWLLRHIPIYARMLQDIFLTIQHTVRRIGDAIVEPVIRIRMFMAGYGALRRNIRQQINAYKSRREHYRF